MQRAAFSSPIPSWQALAAMRKRGQRPAAGVFVTDHYAQRRNLCAGGLFAVGFPEPREVYLAAGLDVALIADRNERSVGVALMLSEANPAYLSTFWRGERFDVVIG